MPCSLVPGMGAGAAVSALADAACPQPLSLGGAPDRGRRLPVDALEARLPAPLPLADRVHRSLLAPGGRRCLPHGSPARPVLPRLLLDVDGVAVLRRNYEPLVDRRPRSLRAAGEARPRRPPVGPVCGRPPDSLGCLGRGRCDRPLSVPCAGSLWGENHGCSPAPIAAARARRS